MDNSITYNFEFSKCFKTALKERGLTQKEFAEAFGLKPSNLSGIISGRRKIPVSLITDFAEFLGTTERELLSYQEGNKPYTQTSNLEEVEKESEMLLSQFDQLISVKSLLKGICDIKFPFSTKLKALKDTYFLTNPCDLEGQMTKLSEACFRKSEKTGQDRIAINTWVVRARAIAQKKVISIPFKEDAIFGIANEIANILHNNDVNTDTEELVEAALLRGGIGYCHVPKEPKASIDGYSFVIKDTPYIILTRRFDRIDNFAFNIMHELGHIANGHIFKGYGMINIQGSYEEDDTIKTKMEEEADKFATEILIPNRIWFLAPKVAMNPYMIQKKYSTWAKSKNLNPWIVLGRVSHETGMYRFTSDETRRIKKSISKLKKD